MNVLYMVSWYFSYSEEHPVGVFHTEAAREIGKHCNVAIYYPYERNIEEFFHKENELGLLTYRSKYKLENKIRNRIYMLRTFKIINKEFRPDLIHAHVGTEAGRFAVMLGKLFGIPVMITEHSSADISGVRSFPHHTYAYWAYKGSCYNACVSDSLTYDLSEIFPQYEFHTIYNGIAMDDFDCKLEHNYRKDGMINMVMVAGMYDKWVKGIPLLLDSLVTIKDKNIDFAMHFVGDGEYRAEFEKIACEKGLVNNCIFHGMLERNMVFEVIKQMDFLISTSRYESFGCSLAEAAMLGTPILATDSGGSKSIVNDKNGILIDGYEANDIADGILLMMKDYKKYQSLESAQEAREKFSIDSITRKYLEVYKSIVSLE